MSSLIYFIENHKAAPKLEDLEAWGIAYAFDGLPSYHADCSAPISVGGNSPGGSGYLLTDDTRLKPYVPAIRPDEQVWRKMPSRPECPVIWVGYYSKAKPTPDSLLRNEPLGGFEVELADKNRWMVPLVQLYDDNVDPLSQLPCHVDLNNEGKVIRGKVIEKHRELAEACESFFDAWTLSAIPAIQEGLDEWSFEYEPTRVVSQATTVLASNYRLGLVEVIMLGLFTMGTNSHQATEVLQVACECALANSLLQKKRDRGQLTVVAESVN